MKAFLRFLGIGLFLVVSMAAAVPTSKTQTLSAPIDGYSVTELVWELEVHPLTKRGEKNRFNGTIQQVVAKALEMNPNYLVHHGLNLTADSDTGGGPAEHKSTGSAALEPRQYYVPDHWFCHGRWYPAVQGRIDEGVNYLNTIEGKPVLGPGPATCARVSCSYGAAIWWCNDVSRTPCFMSATDTRRFEGKSFYVVIELTI